MRNHSFNLMLKKFKNFAEKLSLIKKDYAQLSVRERIILALLYPGFNVIEAKLILTEHVLAWSSWIHKKLTDQSVEQKFLLEKIERDFQERGKLILEKEQEQMIRQNNQDLLRERETLRMRQAELFASQLFLEHMKALKFFSSFLSNKIAECEREIAKLEVSINQHYRVIYEMILADLKQKNIGMNFDTLVQKYNADGTEAKDANGQQIYIHFSIDRDVFLAAIADKIVANIKQGKSATIENPQEFTEGVCKMELLAFYENNGIEKNNLEHIVDKQLTAFSFQNKVKEKVKDFENLLDYNDHISIHTKVNQVRNEEAMKDAFENQRDKFVSNLNQSIAILKYCTEIQAQCSATDNHVLEESKCLLNELDSTKFDDTEFFDLLDEEENFLSELDDISGKLDGQADTSKKIFYSPNAPFFSPKNIAPRDLPSNYSANQQNAGKETNSTQRDSQQASNSTQKTNSSTMKIIH